MTHVIYRNNTAATIVANSVTETSILSWSLPANKLLTNKTARGKIIGTLVNTSGAGGTYTFRLKFGGVTSIDDVTIAVPSVAGATNRRSLTIDFGIQAAGATNAQITDMTLGISDTLALGVTAGFSGNWGVVPVLPPSTITGVGAVTTTNAAVIDITVQCATATASQNVSIRYAYIELI